MQLVGQPQQIRCPQCAAPMDHLCLQGRWGAEVPVDHCVPCRLVWFDRLESVQLAGLGWIALLRELQRGLGDPLPAARPTPLACPLCQLALKPVHNRSRFGRFPALECPRCQGHLHSHAGVLAERGLVRPLAPLERRMLQQQDLTLLCLNCGAPAAGEAEACRWCHSPIVMLDLPRLAQALRLRQAPGPGREHENAASAQAAPPSAAGRPLPWSCPACGGALDPSRHSACPQCGHAVLAPSLPDITPLLDAAEAELRAEIKARTPPPLPLPPLPSKRKRKRGWRDTGLARLLHQLPPDDDGESPSLSWQAAMALGLLLAWWWLS